MKAPNGTSGISPEILIVEDSPVEAEMLRRILVRAGYRVYAVAHNGEDGLQALREHPCTLVMSDINMPLMNGYELCHTIKYDEKLWATPVILVTSLSEPKDIIRALDVGADGYITKPYVEDVLLGRIRSLLANPATRKLADERRRIQLEYDGKKHEIAVGSPQMANLMLSVYENSTILNQELMHIQNQLQLLNGSLDKQVRERTAELLAEKQKLEHSNRALRTLSACNIALVHARTEDELFETVCRHIVENGGHLFAGIYFPDEPPCHVAHFGSDAISRRLVELEQDPEYLHHSLIMTAQQRRQTRVYNGGAVYSLEKLAGLGIESGLALPLINEDRLFGVLTVFSSGKEAFDAAEVKLMEELAGDVAYGIVTLRTRAERDHAAAELRQVLEQTISSIALTLEKRDPYTAGHQQRVAKLAAAIATEMKLPTEQVEGIHFGALLHNIGMVAVPAEILNRPSRLTDLQLALIKQHTQTGFEIVKDIPFPWPVAQMVLQHHERMDGSGYPQGFAGEQIILEARILAVADVVEAVTAYRPYRNALGMDAALDMLTQGRGTLYDPAVVDACLCVVEREAELARVQKDKPDT